MPHPTRQQAALTEFAAELAGYPVRSAETEALRQLVVSRLHELAAAQPGDFVKLPSSVYPPKLLAANPVWITLVLLADGDGAGSASMREIAEKAGVDYPLACRAVEDLSGRGKLTVYPGGRWRITKPQAVQGAS